MHARHLISFGSQRVILAHNYSLSYGNLELAYLDEASLRLSLSKSPLPASFFYILSYLVRMVNLYTDHKHVNFSYGDGLHFSYPDSKIN